ncbi:MAG: dTDP-glucose 4,6-dehydratase [Oscillospiraceae bacterium]
MRLLVTGGAGFIGSHFIRQMLRREHLICCVDNLTYAADLGRLQDCMEHPNFSFVKENICDCAAIKEVFDRFVPEMVVNFAAESHVDRSITDPLIFVRTNVEGVGVLLEQCRRRDIPFHQISTDEVYGPASPEEEQGCREDAPLLPSNPYAATKASADLLALSYFRTYGLPVTITRCCNNFGEGQHREKLIPMTIDAALRGREIPVYGDGLQRRCWISVREHCRAVAAVLEGGTPGEIYNIAPQTELENLTLIHRILDQLGCGHHLIRFVPDRPGHDRRYRICAEKMRQQLGFCTEGDFERELSYCVEWYAKQIRSR